MSQALAERPKLADLISDRAYIRWFIHHPTPSGILEKRLNSLFTRIEGGYLESRELTSIQEEIRSMPLVSGENGSVYIPELIGPAESVQYLGKEMTTWIPRIVKTSWTW